MKKIIIGIILVTLLTACGNSQSGEDEIKVYTRDSASGTREAFESIVGLDMVTDESAETNGNGDMAKQVGANDNAIGYVSLTTDFAVNNLKPLKYEGVIASIETVNNSSYKLSRPFSFVTRESGDFETQEKEELILAILDYIENSREGREVILSAGGIVDVSTATSWEILKEKHPIVDRDNSQITIKTAGSTSVEKTLTEAITSFIPMAGNFKYEPNHTGSSDGYKRVLGSDKNSANAADIGFASRDFKSDEDLSKAMLSGVYSKDAVVVVVQKNNNTIDSLSAERIREIFSGEISKWSELN